MALYYGTLFLLRKYYGRFDEEKSPRLGELLTHVDALWEWNAFLSETIGPQAQSPLEVNDVAIASSILALNIIARNVTDEDNAIGKRMSLHMNATEKLVTPCNKALKMWGGRCPGFDISFSYQFRLKMWDLGLLAPKVPILSSLTVKNISPWSWQGAIPVPTPAFEAVLLGVGDLEYGVGELFS